MPLTSRQTALMVKLYSCISSVGEKCGEDSKEHLDLREFQNDLKFYMENRVEKER